jgi:energy-coupling factor transport system ATP-binding protein
VPPAITIEDLSFTYPKQNQPALRNLSGSIDPGRWTVLMGREGAGKSTLCFALNGLIPHFFRGRYQGRVMVGGRDPARTKVPEMARRVGLVLQDFETQLFSTSVEMEMVFGLENLGLPRGEMEARIQRYLEWVGLEKMRQREPASLSGGEKQRLAIGAVLAMEPDFLVLDEPTTDLDPAGRQAVFEIITHWRNLGKTLVLVEQDPDVILEADQLWVIQEGELKAVGMPETLFREGSLAEQGLQRPALMELFHLLGWAEGPLTVDEAEVLIRRKNLLSAEKNYQPTEGQIKAGKTLVLADRVEYRYPEGGAQALNQVSLEIGEGEFIALLGPNGSGKSTLARLFNGLLKPTAGRVLVKGCPTTTFSPPDMAQEVGYVFQNPDHQLFARTVEEEVGFGPRVLGLQTGTIRQRVREALEAVDLQGYEKKEPFALTKGERQRLAVASMLASRPGLLILDEPTTGLDYGHQRGLLEMLNRLNHQGHTIVIVTHHLWVAAEYCRRCLVLKEGRVWLDGATRSVLQKEALLKEASLVLPPIVQLSNRFDFQGLTATALAGEIRA